MSTLEISDLRKSFGAVEVLKNINLSARSGEFVALVGPSGCGKSTLLSMIAGLESVTSGEIRIDGHLVNDEAPKDRDIAMVFQSYALYPTMSVRQNMSFGMECRGIPKAEQDREIERVAAMLQITPLLNRKPGQLSGGQRQRVAMGRALVRDPKMFLFDEPLSNLDAKLRIEMRSEIKKLHQAVGKTTVYVTHDQIEAMTLATRIAVMNKGILQQYDTPDEIYRRPANMFVAGFMGSPTMNFLTAVVTEPQDEAMLRLDGPGDVMLPLPDGAAPPPAGSRVVLGIRPEHFSPVAARRAERKAIRSVPVTAAIDMLEPTGSETILMGRIADQPVVLTCEPDEAPRVNEEACFEIDIDRVCLFDPKTEVRL
ncbi:ABC transporter ATP-binding protein [Paracoccus seriniphilus]|uniref:Carbohydrate ABC transporter ATP-binding protein, CUT1 family n=1 Tax=Paracoccus seriniphilus TaxID=184748 RepID=A0A239PTS8_9RHOB|nr:sn-glycerol-3-phosphate ABC transporter ATP-binding protein UgpC [Paracoccus seriniphilus]WCR16431.1 sn-glycerol-3-phosphate ABC transporter ATP-binding protein UgpC [Paracoccus seriniphilus]SNT73538.1 carbohydrate ABC transporter ATP-binding protein, CUT1 family [Paracoccus seriniphilus]